MITNAVDTSLFTAMDKSRCRTQLGLPVNGNLVGAVGDISNYRGADTLYQAFSEHAEDLAGTTLVVAGHRDGQTKTPTSDNVIDLGCLPPADVPVLLNCLDVAIIYNRSSTFGDFCFPQKFYEAVACDLPVVVANVGELGYLLRAQTELFYEDEDVTSLVTAINRQLTNKLRAGVAVPSWAEQAALLLQLSQSVQGEG